MDQPTEIIMYRPKLTDLPAFLPFACRQLEAPFRLRIQFETIEEYVSPTAADDKSKKSKRDKVMSQVHTSAVHCSTAIEQSTVEPVDDDEIVVVLRIRCDTFGKPVELLFYRCILVPRLLMKIIGLCIPYQEYLSKITIRWGRLDGSIVYEIAKFLPLSHVTEICLDDSPVLHRNYYMLLERQSRLRSLSLARCGLADEDCAALAARLACPRPASRTLVLLCLESNHISDEGARALGEALRTNRSLRHLNLAGNAITSVGAAHIFRSLSPFPVLSADMMSKRRRTFEYLKLRRDVYAKCYNDLINSVDQMADGGRSRRRNAGLRSRKSSTSTLVSIKDSSANTLADRAEVMTDQVIGLRSEPFDPSELFTKGNASYCVGNFSLNYLNLAYNNLDCTSAARLAEVMADQVGAGAVTGAGRHAGPGLLRVVLEGNALTETCESVRVAERLLERTLARVGTPIQRKGGRKSDRVGLKVN